MVSDRPDVDPGIRQVAVSPRHLRRGRRRRWARALREFAGVPLLVLLAFCLLAVVSIIADQTHSVGPLNDARAAAGRIVGKDAATMALQAIATGLVTVASITFSVLLLAVQQTASSLSPVVFDQFIRRKRNQAFLGFFVGLALFAYVVMAAVQNSTPPILGATMATLLTLVALVILLVLVYSTVSQMRPTSVVRVIHDQTLAARREESALVRRTRRQSTSRHDVAAIYPAGTNGYLTHVDLELLESALADAGDAEICLHVTTGQHLCYGDPVASVRDGNVDRAEHIARQVAAALTISPQRDLAHDPTTGIDELGNSAWTSGSTAKQNPEVAREALFALEDLATRWLTTDPAHQPEEQGRRLPIVYRDNDVDRLLDVLYSMLVVAHESQQHMLAATVLGSYDHLLRRAPAGPRERLERDIIQARELLDDIPDSPQLRAARRAEYSGAKGAADLALARPLP
jgi:uncharacterized membrane protein